MDKAIDCVYLIDDDPIQKLLVESLLKKKLSKPLPELIFFEAIQPALTYFKEHPGQNKASLLLLDLIMPQLNGFDFLDHYAENQWKEKFPALSIYVLTGSTSERDHHHAMTYDFVSGYILKPLFITQLGDLFKSLALQN